MTSETLYNICVGDRAQSFRARSGSTLLASMLASGLGWVNIGCRSGGCGVCRIRVLEGQYDSLKMSRSRISEADETTGVVLACRILPKSDMYIEPFPLEILQ